MYILTRRTTCYGVNHYDIDEIPSFLYKTNPYASLYEFVSKDLGQIIYIYRESSLQLLIVRLSHLNKTIFLT